MIIPEQFTKIYIDCLVFMFGAVVGSFLNVCIYRMPLGLSVVSPPSACPHCGTHIRWYHNIPLFTYLMIGGKCRYCGAKITSRYFFVELLTAVFFITIWLHFPGWLPPIYWILIAGFIVATFIDFEHFIIPNEITLGGVVVGFVCSALYPPLMGETSNLRSAGLSLLGIVVGGGLLYLVVELGKLMFGKRKVPLDPGTIIKVLEQKSSVGEGEVAGVGTPAPPIAEQKMMTEEEILRQAQDDNSSAVQRILTVGDEEVPWEDLFFRDSDRITFQAATLKFGEQAFENAKIVITETTLFVNDQSFELNAIGPIEATTDLIVLPREAMGLGDVKLLAAIGAFLGWRATLFTVFSSSLLGGLIGGALLLTKKANWQGRIPYGPYLVVGAVLWVFFGREILDWYGNFMRG